MDRLHAEVVEGMALCSGHLLKWPGSKSCHWASVSRLHEWQLSSIFSALRDTVVATATSTCSSTSVTGRLDLVAFDVSLSASLAACAGFLDVLVGISTMEQAVSQGEHTGALVLCLTIGTVMTCLVLHVAVGLLLYELDHGTNGHLCTL